MPSRAGQGNLPHELTSFIGRRAEVQAAKRELTRTRLLTLTGAGGVGKTRLAVRVAAALQRTYPDGAWLVELDQIRDETLVPQAVAAVFGLRERHGRPPATLLVDHLVERQVLLVLDNCEHVVAAVAKLVETLLRASPALRILATSRESLEIDGETLQPVPPLSTPEPEQAGSPGELAMSEAVALFADRARSVQPGFSLTRDNAAAVGQICRRLDGVPLAIELVAARLRVLSPEQINDRLRDRFALLTGGSRAASVRHQTLRDCIGWSFDLGTRSEQRLWARLSVFAGGFEMDAVEAVCDGPDEVEGGLLTLLTALVTKSIVIAEEQGGTPRYRMLDSIRTYGLERLREAGDEARLRRRHRDWYEGLALAAEADWIGPRQVEWLDRLGRAYPEIRAVLRFCLATPEETGSAFRIGAALHAYWLIGGLASEGRRWLGQALATPGPPTVDRLRATYTATILAGVQGDITAASALSHQAYRLAEQLGDPRSGAIAALAAGAVAVHSGDPVEAELLDRRALQVFRAADDVYWTVMTLAGLAMTKGFRGDPDGAAEAYEALLSITQERGEIRLQSLALWGLGVGLWARGDSDQAALRLTESLRLRSRMRDTFGSALCLDALAWIAGHRGQAHRAATLLGIVDGLSRTMGAPAATYPDLLAYHEDCTARTRAALGEEAFHQAFVRATSMNLDEAVGYALTDDPAGPRRAARREAADSGNEVTPREWQICELVAEGLSNKEIAARLVISQRTAESHVQNVLNKMGFANRSLIATWVAQRRSP
jgi:predicted ATPase/DNA-binding CsgD family transcriptional regulator